MYKDIGTSYRSIFCIIVLLGSVLCLNVFYFSSLLNGTSEILIDNMDFVIC